MSNQRTYEILGKWIGNKNNVRVIMKPNACPKVNIKDNTITLPSNIDPKNIYPALAELMHEAAHLRHTTKIPADKLAQDPVEHSILNAIEDIRIDNKNIQLLPNIRDFYELMYTHGLENVKKTFPKHSVADRVMCNNILDLEGFGHLHIPDKQSEELNNKCHIDDLMLRTVQDLDAKSWDSARENILKIKKIFKDNNTQPQTQQPVAGQGQVADDVRGMLVNKGDIFKPGKGDASGSVEDIGSIGLQEQTRQRFKELLNIKQIKHVRSGNTINTDNLPAFLVGDLDELFHEEKVIRVKKSKLMILMDGSGSMGEQLMDGNQRRITVAECVQSLVDILDEVRELEGINVDYDLACFTGSYFPLSRKNWKKEYLSHGGGTSLYNGFSRAHEHILEDQEIDGKKMIIMFTDGEVTPGDIDKMKRLILKHNSDVRCMIIGVGSDVNGELVKKVVGDHNILAKDLADVILMESIMDMME